MFGKRKKPPAKPKPINRAKHAKAMVARWDTTKFFQGVKKRKL